VTVAVSDLTRADRARMLREHMRDPDNQLSPLGLEVDAYLRAKRKRLTKGSDLKYTGTLRRLVEFFTDLELADFEPPIGTTRVEEFLDAWWGADKAAPRTYNVQLSVVKDFFKWQVAHGRMHANPVLAIERAKVRDPHREVFNADQFRAIIASQDDLRDRIVLRLMLVYGLRKAELRAVRFKHFDHVRLTITVFGKGGKVSMLPIPDQAFWHDLERLILDAQAEPSHFLMPGRRGNRHGSRLLPDTQISNHALHDWWYARLADAGIVVEGTTKGERMHKARHTAGQNLLNATGNLKAVQKLLRHESILTTADVYVSWDLDQLAQSLLDAQERSE
jgi:integrase/recombinase XerD